MDIYETEEQQVEALKKWWQENGTASIIGLVLGIALILGFDLWQGHKKDTAEQASALYDQLLKAVETDKLDSVNALADKIQQQYAKTDYADYSGLIQAKAKVKQGDIAGAKTLLTKISQGTNKELSNVAKMRLVRLMMANKEYEQGLKLINEVDPASTSSFSGGYDELLGDLDVALDRVDQARTSYESAIRNGQTSPLLQLKLDDLTAPEHIAAVKK